MIRRITPAALGLLATLTLLPGCYGQELTYRLDPELGVPYKGAMKTETRTQMQMPAQGFDLDMTMTMKMDHDVVFEAGDDDTVVGRNTITVVSAETGGLPGVGQGLFDLNDLYQGMVGLTFTMAMTRGGEMVEFGGLQELVEAMLDRMEASDQVRAMASQILEANFGEEQISQMSGQSGVSMPDHPVAVGDTWTDSVSDAMGLELETTFTLAERSDGRASVEAAGTLSGTEDAGFELPGLPAMPGMEMQFESLSGSIAGAYELDEATGLAVAYGMDMTMDTEMVIELPQVEGQPAGASSMSMSMSLQSTVEGTLQKVE